MINIQVHHIAIRFYLDKAQSLSSKGKGRLSFFVGSSGMQVKGGDIETNPSPTYNLEKCMGPFIREIVNYLVKLQAFCVHVMHNVDYVGLR